MQQRHPSLKTSNTYDGINLTPSGGQADNITITNNVISGLTDSFDSSVSSMRYGINFNGSTSSIVDCTVTGNRIANALTGAINQSGTLTRLILRDNPGFTTENSGTATVVNGTVSIVVTHGLAVTPTADDISITPTNNLGTAIKFWISTLTATQFTINVDADPGATTATFAWKAIVL